MYQTSFKRLEDIYEPDLANKAWLRLDPKTGSSHRKTLEDHYEDISVLKLPDQVPENVRFHFDTARNLLLYSWFVWRFRAVATLYSYAGLELALRIRCLEAKVIEPNSRCGLRRLLKEAADRRWLDVTHLTEYINLDENQKAALERWRLVFDDDLAQNWAPQVDPSRFAEMLFNYIPGTRNELAHGTTNLWGNPLMTLLTCRDLIAQLFVA